jgi:glycosyltransferase involved in cell wall biosynthesis
MIRVALVEASTGGVVGGSLTGLYHLVRGLDRTRFAPTMVLYEPKSIESDLAALAVPVAHVTRRRLSKQHALLGYDAYHRAKAAHGVRSVLRTARQSVRLLVEELPAALRLVRVLRRTGADVVHLGNGVRANFDGILAAMLTRTPCVCHVKGFEKYAARERWAARHVDVLVCMTRAVREHCARAGVHGRRTEVVYDALDDAGFRPTRPAAAVRAELGVANGAPCVGVIGNIQEWKGQLVLIEAMARVASTIPAAHAVVIGGVHRAGAAYLEQMQRRIRELGLGTHVLHTGFRTDVADLVNALDVVVHTSVRPEPFGRVILEAMLLGKPVVATDAGGVPELIQHGTTGFLTPPGDADALGACLVRVLGDAALRARVGAAARRWATDQFGLERHVAGFSQLYEDLVRGH